MSIVPTLTCRGNEPVMIVELGTGRLDPPVTLHPGEFLILLPDGKAAAMEGDCMVGGFSKVVGP